MFECVPSEDTYSEKWVPYGKTRALYACGFRVVKPGFSLTCSIRSVFQTDQGQRREDQTEPKPRQNVLELDALVPRRNDHSARKDLDRSGRSPPFVIGIVQNDQPAGLAVRRENDVLVIRIGDLDFLTVREVRS